MAAPFYFQMGRMREKLRRETAVSPTVKPSYLHVIAKPVRRLVVANRNPSGENRRFSPPPLTQRRRFAPCGVGSPGVATPMTVLNIGAANLPPAKSSRKGAFLRALSERLYTYLSKFYVIAKPVRRLVVANRNPSGENRRFSPPPLTQRRRFAPAAQRVVEGGDPYECVTKQM